VFENQSIEAAYASRADQAPMSDHDPPDATT
jgi:hypothetical protein